jgi:hypothetical protein
MNEYLDEFERLGGSDWRKSFIERCDQRDELVKRYAWAVPTNEAIQEIVRYSPIIEIGAGTGYWAALIQQAGAKILAFDRHPPDAGKNKYRHDKTYMNVQRGSYGKLRKYPDYTLFLCWPPYATRMAHDCLSTYRGNIFLYVGEMDGGCNGDDQFWRLVDQEWSLFRSFNIPQWAGIHDDFCVFKRNGA